MVSPLLESILTFLGLYGNPQESARGKRRVVTYMAFISFVLIAAALGDQEWIYGASETDIYSSKAPSRLLGAIVEASCPEMGDEPHGERNLQFRPVTKESYFQVGLATAAVVTARQAPYVNEEITSVCGWRLYDFLNDWNDGVSTSGSYLSKGKIVSYSAIQATEGLLGFALVLQLLAWFGMALVQYDAPMIGSSKNTVLAVRILQGVALLITFAAVVNFGTSSSMTEFCSAFDPHPDKNKGCGYSSGFAIGIAAIVFLTANTALSCLWMSWDLSSRMTFGAARGGYAEVGVPSSESGGASSAALFSGGGSFQG